MEEVLNQGVITIVLPVPVDLLLVTGCQKSTVLYSIRCKITALAEVLPRRNRSKGLPRFDLMLARVTKIWF